MISALASGRAFAVEAIVTNAQLPSDGWTWKAADKEEPDARTMYVKKVGEQVSLRIQTYDVPITSAGFLEAVREQIMKKPDYQGANITTVGPMDFSGKSWDVFTIKRKDEINQQILGRKIDSDTVFMVIYTGAGSYYDTYYNDFKSFIGKSGN